MNQSMFPFNKVTIGLPVESFAIKAFIATEARMPVVTEYVLRLLRVCGAVSMESFRNYFGFTNGEAIAVAESLQRAGLVQLDNDYLALTHHASLQFDQSPDESPRFTKVEPRRDTVTFDLLAFRYIPSRDIKSLSANCIRLDAEKEKIGQSVKLAKKAYFEQFFDISKKLDEKRSRSFGVYSIDDICSKRRGYLPVPVTLSLDEKGQVEYQLDQAFEGGAHADMLSAFRANLNKELLSYPQDGVANLEDFIEQFSAHFLRPYLIGGRFDFAEYAKLVKEKRLAVAKEVVPLFGNLYLPENLELLTRRIENQHKKAGKTGRVLSSLAWVAPNNSLWGRGGDFAEAVKRLAHVLAEPAPHHDKLFVFCSAEEEQESTVATKFKETNLTNIYLYRSADAGVKAINGSLELLLYPTGFMVALCHLPSPDFPSVRIPVGFISIQPKHLELAHKLILASVGNKHYVGRFNPNNKVSTRSISTFETACSFLNYTDYRANR